MGSVQKSPSALGGVAKWFGLQIASKALGFALGLPIVTATIAAALLFAKGQPVEWVFMGFLAALAFAATAANQVRAFALSYSVSGKFQYSGVNLALGLTKPDKRSGYSVALYFTNDADIPLEYEVARASAHLNGRVVEQSPGTKGSVVKARGMIGYSIGIVPMQPVVSDVLNGELEIEYSYGRPGRLRYTRFERLEISAHTDANGVPAALTINNRL